MYIKGSLFRLQTGILKGKRLKAWAEHRRIKIIQVPPNPQSPPPPPFRRINEHFNRCYQFQIVTSFCGQLMRRTNVL